MSAKKLHQVFPREQAGAGSGKAFEFQYHQAAQACLELLEENGATSVFCEWHDDFVVESQGNSAILYGFYQVKTRSLSEGPWPLREVLGLGRLTKTGGKAADKRAIIPRLLEHFFNFGPLCDKVVLVTNAALNPAFKSFVQDTSQAADCAGLSSDSKILLTETALAYRKVGGQFSGITESQLLAFLKNLQVLPEVARFDRSEDDLQTELGKRIRQLSEIDLTVSQTIRIGGELVSLVRAKSHRVLKNPPKDDAELRQNKAIARDDVLKILALSPEAYRVLRTQGKDALLSLSRLHRLCQKSRVPEALIVDICRYKTSWDAWYIQERHSLEDVDYTALRSRCIQLLQLHVAGQLEFDKLADEAKALAAEFNPKLAGPQLTPTLVLGFIFSIASETVQ